MLRRGGEVRGSYGAFAASYFILFNNNVAGTITAQGRDLTRTMSTSNNHYWHDLWHEDYDLHQSMFIKNVGKIEDNVDCSVYADTDSVFVGFDAAIKSCTWKDIYFNTEYLNSLTEPFVVVYHRHKPIFKNDNCILITGNIDEIDNVDASVFIMDGYFIKNRELNKHINGKNIIWNWSYELDFIHGLDHFRYCDYFKDCLNDYAASFGVENKEDFELERVSESIIQIAKKKYIQNIVYEDGLPYDRLSYIYPKGVELVRSSTPLFAREKIVGIVKYLFTEPDTFNIKELLKLVKNLRKEFEMCIPDKIDDIAMQSSCSNYEEKVIDDKDKLEFVSGAHFAVKCSAYYNFLLNKNKKFQDKYEFIKSGTKIKYYYCKSKENPIFAYQRGSFPIEFAPEIDLDEQFAKSILSPINSIIEPLGMPAITQRLTVVMSIFGND